MTTRLVTILLFVLPLALAVPAGAASALWQTNAEGDDVHIYDTATGRLIRTLVVGPNPHGIAAPLAQNVVFVSLERNGEPNGELLWIDPATYRIVHRLTVGPEPHAIAVTPDGQWVYVPCRDEHYWVVDAREQRVVRRIRTGGRPHNTTASSDGTRMYLSPMGAPRAVTIVNVPAGHVVDGTIPFSNSVRPPALSAEHGLFFQHVDGLNGFEVADIQARKSLARVEHSTRLGVPVWPRWLGFLHWSGLNRCHGLAVRPGGGEIWSVCGRWVTIHDLAKPGWPEAGVLELSGKGYWLTFSPDGQFAYVAVAGEGRAAQVDAASRKVIRYLDAGRYPKRNLVIEALAKASE